MTAAETQVREQILRAAARLSRGWIKPVRARPSIPATEA